MQDQQSKVAKRRQRGATMVEAALTITIFLMVMFGIVGFGRAVWAYSWTSHAAREAARWASVRGSKGKVVVAAADVTTFVKQNMMGLDATEVTVNTDWTPDNHPGSTVKVQVSYTVTQLVPWVGDITVQSTSEMPISQ